MSTSIVNLNIRMDKDLKADKKTLDAIQNVEEGKNLSRKFSSVAELMEDLNAWSTDSVDK